MAAPAVLNADSGAHDNPVDKTATPSPAPLRHPQPQHSPRSSPSRPMSRASSRAATPSRFGSPTPSTSPRTPPESVGSGSGVADPLIPNKPMLGTAIELAPADGASEGAPTTAPADGAGAALPSGDPDAHLPSASSCDASAAVDARPPPRVPCTFAIAHPERPCPASAIESLVHLQDTGIPADDILRMIRGLIGLPPSAPPSLAQSPTTTSTLPTPFQTPAQTPAHSPVARAGARQWDHAPASKQSSPAVSLKAEPSAKPAADTAPTSAQAPAPAASPAAPTTPAAPTATSPVQAPQTPAENSRLATFLNGKPGTTSPPLHKTQSTPPVSRSGTQSRRSSMPAPPPPSAMKDGTNSRPSSRAGRRISFDCEKVTDKDREALREQKTAEPDFLPDTAGDRKPFRPRADSDARASVAHTPDLKRKTSLVIDTNMNGDDMDGMSEDTHAHSGVLARARPRIQWASFLPPLAAALANPDTFSTGVATGRLFGLIHTRLGERRMATPMLLLAGAFLSAVGGDATGSRLSALRLDEALSTAGMIEAFLQNAMLAELTAPPSATPASNFSGKFAEARGTAVSAHTRVRSNVNVLRDVLNRHLMSTVQRHSSKLAQEVFGTEPNVISVLERTRSTCVRAGLTLTLWRAVALAYLAEVYIAVLHHLLKLRTDGYTAGHRQAYQRVAQALDTIDTWAKKQEVRVNLAGVIRTFLGELITPSPTVSPIMSALDRVRSEHAGAHTQALAILRLAGLPDREIRALDKLAFAIEDAVERSNASSRDLPNGELVNKALAWSGYE